MKLRVPRVLLLAALLCGGTTTVRAEPQEYVVVMDNMNFGQIPAGAKVGDTIVWENRDTVQHTVTARDGSFDVRLQPGKKARTVMQKAGNIAVYCIYHPMMRTTLRVAAAN